MDSEDQRRFDHSLRVGQLASGYVRIAADESRKSLERKARKAGLSYDQYVFFYILHPTWPRPKPPPPPTREENLKAFFTLSGWTRGSKKNGGIVLNQAGKLTSLPNKQEIDYIIKEAKRLGMKFLTDVQIAEFIKKTKVKVEVESESFFDSERY